MTDTATVPSVPRWTGAQQAMAVLVALAILLDGFDSQLISLTLPAIAADWRIEKSAFAGVMAIGTIGIALGSLLAGFANDRIGRRWSLIGSLALVGAANLAIGATTGLATFGAVRFMIGIGIGAAFASATTSLAEFTPAHRRSTVIAIGILCMPVGGLLASTTCAALLGSLGWRPMFVIGGAMPLVFSGVLILLLPETPAFLATRPGRAAELARVAARLGLAEIPATPPPRGGWNVAGLLAGPLRRDTLLVWTAFFACLLSSYIGIGWIPSLFAQAGGSLALSSMALATNGAGAIAGSILCVAFVQRLGTKRPMIGFGLLGIVFFVALALLFRADAPVPVLFALLALSSLAIAITQSLLYVLVAQLYPAHLRGSGVGIGMAVGRLGAVASAFVGGWALQRGGTVFFLVDAATLALCILAATQVRGHVGPAGSRSTAND